MYESSHLVGHSTICRPISMFHIALPLQPRLNLLTSTRNGFGEMEIAAAQRKYFKGLLMAKDLCMAR